MTQVIAHRGASAAHPENTLDAFLAAREAGADMVELDVRRTADGALAVHHDPHVPDGALVRDVKAGDLPLSVPLLGAALDACAGMGVNVEVKNIPGEPDHDPDEWLASAVAEALERDRDRVLVSSFSLTTIDRVRAADQGLATAWLTLAGYDQEWALATAERHGHRALHPQDAGVTARLVTMAHERGMAVNVWTVDDPGRMAELAGFGVDGIVTNVPEVLRRLLDEWASRG